MSLLLLLLVVALAALAFYLEYCQENQRKALAREQDQHNDEQLALSVKMVAEQLLVANKLTAIAMQPNPVPEREPIGF